MAHYINICWRWHITILLYCVRALFVQGIMLLLTLVQPGEKLQQTPCLASFATLLRCKNCGKCCHFDTWWNENKIATTTRINVCKWTFQMKCTRCISALYVLHQTSLCAPIEKKCCACRYITFNVTWDFDVFARNHTHWAFCAHVVIKAVVFVTEGRGEKSLAWLDGLIILDGISPEREMSV